MYILFEGPDFSGKSTQVKIVSDWMREAGRPVLATKEPGCKTDQVCVDIRKLLLEPNLDIVEKSALFLFLADRAQHFEKTVSPALKAGYTVVSDRGSLSTIAYYLAAQKKMWDFGEVSMSMLGSLLSLAQPAAPDLCFVSEADPMFSHEVAQARNADRIELRGDTFQNKVNRYFDLFSDPSPTFEVAFFSKEKFFPKRIVRLPPIPLHSQAHITSFILKTIADVESLGNQI